MPEHSIPPTSGRRYRDCTSCPPGYRDCPHTERGHWEYRATCNDDTTPYDEGWTEDRSIAKDEAALLSEALGKTGVRIQSQWVVDA